MAALLPYRIGKRKAKKNPKRRMGLVEMQRVWAAGTAKSGRQSHMAASGHDMTALKC